MFGQLASTFILLGSIASYKPANNLRQIETQQADVQTSYNLLMGSYNYKESFDLTGLYADLGQTHETIYLQTDLSNGYLCAYYNEAHINGNTEETWLSQLDFSLVSSGGEIIRVDFTLFDILGHTYTYYEIIRTGDNLTDLNYPKMMFDNFRSIVLSTSQSKLFNAIFTHQDNSYFVSYNGYYNFLNNSTINQDVAVYGSISFNNILYMGFGNRNTTMGIKYLRFYRYDIDSNYYKVDTYETPLDPQIYYTVNNVYLNGVKMPTSTYTYLSSIGIFAYQRDTSLDNTTFGDLLFSVMDTPVYFISRLLSFELFGVNMFVAFTGLLTVCVILVLIRKFF